ncbi:hypothetical protein PROFUN_13056 [Planoprotostelium fungivorum]|uniref:Uncharacterized protein n=1 Tax=Planoprotostelium fungivorum TaxID=1890364 RepID=A0A2P6N5E1_9EUKA|nr:hypothetical protein PROFUN_13056 [Planoprotostelium fungivorum]
MSLAEYEKRPKSVKLRGLHKNVRASLTCVTDINSAVDRTNYTCRTSSEFAFYTHLTYIMYGYTVHVNAITGQRRMCGKRLGLSGHVTGTRPGVVRLQRSQKDGSNIEEMGRVVVLSGGRSSGEMTALVITTNMSPSLMMSQTRSTDSTSFEVGISKVIALLLQLSTTSQLLTMDHSNKPIAPQLPLLLRQLFHKSRRNISRVSHVITLHQADHIEFLINSPYSTRKTLPSHPLNLALLQRTDAGRMDSRSSRTTEKGAATALRYATQVTVDNQRGRKGIRTTNVWIRVLEAK